MTTINVAGTIVITSVTSSVEPDGYRPKVVFFVEGLSEHGPVEFIGRGCVPNDIAGAVHAALGMFASYLNQFADEGRSPCGPYKGP